MKRFLLLCLVGILAGQSLRASELDDYFVCHSKDNVVEMLDKLLSLGTRNYELRDVRKKNADNDHILLYTYKGAKPGDVDSVNVLVVINFFMEGSNPDLEIVGTPVYKVNDIYGAYLDIFPIYQLVDPDATVESTSKYGASKNIQGYNGKVFYSIRKSNNPNQWHFRRF